MEDKKIIEELEERIHQLEQQLKRNENCEYMCLTEYNEAETMEMFRQEGFQEGFQKGFQEGLRVVRLLEIRNLMDCTGWTAEKTMDQLKIPHDQRTALYAGLSKNA